MSGLALSDACRNAADRFQENATLMKASKPCERREKVGEKLMMGIEHGDLSLAIHAVEVGLEKCRKLSKECAFQVAPVLVNQMATMAAMNGGNGGMMPVFSELPASPQ